MVKVENLNLKFSNEVIIKDFSLTINEGEKIVIHGESGSGKSSFFNILLGFENSYSGKITIDRSNIAWVPQEISIPVKTLEEAVDQVFSLKANVQNKPSEQQIIDLLQKLGVKITSLNKNINELSGGERQRFFITISLLQNKSILMLDEPTSALDFASTQKLIEVIKSYNKTMIAISHDANFIKSFNRDIIFTKH